MKNSCIDIVKNMSHSHGDKYITFHQIYLHEGKIRVKKSIIQAEFSPIQIDILNIRIIFKHFTKFLLLICKILDQYIYFL